jgi:hypothetical protein
MLYPEIDKLRNFKKLQLREKSKRRKIRNKMNRK